jgi:prepilin-type N-terminal cleavage/methylation domain-containing protein
MKRRADRTLGMSLVELMIVVVIIGILAAIATVGFRRYIARARLSEATAMLAEFSSKEQLYYLDNGQFIEAHSDAQPVRYPSQSEQSNEFWPSDPNQYFDSSRTPVSTAPVPASWRRLGIRPRWSALYCTYIVNAGAPGGAPWGAILGVVGPQLWPSPPNVPWFYAIAACNLHGNAGWPNTAANQFVTTLVLTHDSPAISTSDENQ